MTEGKRERERENGKERQREIKRGGGKERQKRRRRRPRPRCPAAPRFFFLQQVVSCHQRPFRPRLGFTEKKTQI